jgi:hypothetical protein
VKFLRRGALGPEANLGKGRNQFLPHALARINYTITESYGNRKLLRD